jgi:hypothetical protein
MVIRVSQHSKPELVEEGEKLLLVLAVACLQHRKT